MTALISSAIPLVVLLSQLVFVFLVAAVIFRSSWGNSTVEFLSRRAVSLSFLTALGAVVGSLFYSNIIGYAPCELCWWQRILLYPQVILFLTALKYKTTDVFKYAWRLSVLALIISVYQAYVQAGGSSVLPCTAAGSACAKVFVNAFGYITIPMMSVTVCAYLILFALVALHHEKNNSHA